ncbi:unnamed protein product [Sphenostylis stenocarpa]|uniref:Uncharacterized protein n=1 Tax=Sphenostylis stenocarpa TaxID=92480 RepID=A0AA86RWA6_9FABA|nr:unnamed protein product [Sphenostylis stenocarpa]
MPGEEQEDIVMTSTQSNILNVTCPLTGKPLTELAEPVRRLSKDNPGRDKLVQDPLLLIEIDEMRKMNKETDVEDYTMLNGE